MRLLKIVLVMSFLCVSIPGYSSDLESPRKVSLVLHWLPQAQFAGYYVAVKKGIYRKYGLDVSIISGGIDKLPEVYLNEGKADFAVMWLNMGIKARDKGIPLVNVAQIVQRSSLMFMAKKNRGIEKVSDIQGRKVGVWPGLNDEQANLFFKKNGLDVTVVPQYKTVNVFLRDGIDVVSAMWYNEYHTIINAGYNDDELTSFFLFKHGVNFPEDGIYTLSGTFQAEPQLVYNFVRASKEGWKYVFQHREEALRIMVRCMEDAHVPADIMHQRWMLDKIRDLVDINDSGQLNGVLSRRDYEFVVNALRKNNTINAAPTYTDFYTDCYDDIQK